MYVVFTSLEFAVCCVHCTPVQFAVCCVHCTPVQFAVCCVCCVHCTQVEFAVCCVCVYMCMHVYTHFYLCASSVRVCHCVCLMSFHIYVCGVYKSCVYECACMCSHAHVSVPPVVHVCHVCVM
eukprot:TRINITY_DN14426_c0_g1_i1.p1 TRINITY_DN14426_c0_g1~~TRINITY_DN14426_c0_g1_i1.p1  ORF type:complete len:123 (+),score=20.56 TRINITY_DN14426_c0_g1_i1:119-487(+)